MADTAYEVQTVDRLIAVINHGDDGADATRDYRTIMETLAKRLENHGGSHKAKLVITIEFTADAKGKGASLSTSSESRVAQPNALAI